MKKILVLGGNGFIGRNLCDFLTEMNEEVYSFDITIPKERNNNVNYISGDFFCDSTLENVIQGMDVVFHAICTLNPGNSEQKYLWGYEKDFVQTVKLCSYIKKCNSKLIFLSSGGTVYGNQVVQPIKESALPSPINHYGNLKLCIENTIQTFNTQMERKMLITRISNPYGPGQDYLKGVGFIDAALKKALQNETIEIYGDGTIVRDYIYINDVCRMLYALIDYTGEYEIFNLSSNIGTSQKEVLEIIEGLFPDIKIQYTSSRIVDARKIVLDNSRIMKVIPMSCVGIKEGIEKYFLYLGQNI